MPVELLVTIFQNTLAPEGVWETIQHTKSLTRLMLVCRWWHKIILDAPELWTAISCDDRLDESEIGKALRLSRRMPLDVIFRPPYTEGRKLPHLFRFVNPESLRWRRLVLKYDGPAEDLELLEEVCAPAIEDFDLLLVGQRVGSSAERPLNIFNGSPLPKLQKFSLAWTAIRWELGQLAGGALRSLYLREISNYAPSVAQILDIVQQSPLLEAILLMGVALVTGNTADLPTLQPPSLRTVFLSDLPSAAIRQLVPRLQPTSECQSYTVENFIPMQEAPDFFALAHESVLATILRGRTGKRVYICYSEGHRLEVLNGASSRLRLCGDAVEQALEWVCDCLASPNKATSGPVCLELWSLKNFSSQQVPRNIRALCRIPNVVELRLHLMGSDTETVAALLEVLSRPMRDLPSEEQYWGLPQLQFVTVQGAAPIMPSFIQMVRARLDLEKTLNTQTLHRPYPLHLITVRMGPVEALDGSFSRSELDELQDILEEEGGNLYCCSKLWKDWPRDRRHGLLEPVL
ncbi:hypothetical protein FS837_005666 [Tulasnella sp. UAMH 9824]|nr:hypothetical protein FS837_005666 [Tulasnella sp. UAMH 9824]